MRPNHTTFSSSPSWSQLGYPCISKYTRTTGHAADMRRAPNTDGSPILDGFDSGTRQRSTSAQVDQIIAIPYKDPMQRRPMFLVLI